MIRSKSSGGGITYAGTGEELAALAIEYADGMRGRYDTNQRARFRNAADALARGETVVTDGVRFWPDGPDGRPFDGNRDYMPEPSPEWQKLEAQRKAREDAKTPSARR